MAAQAHAAGRASSRLHLVEALEDALLLFAGNTDAGVGHSHHHSTLIQSRTSTRPPAG
jgi:hypothetical protein